ncbi:hypothetical protein KEJ29_03755 [Candidatus Bathyarchaeota archaeon]|nr:hypothetical protein [Candidatus Bathyarchaeota archaeon]
MTRLDSNSMGCLNGYCGKKPYGGTLSVEVGGGWKGKVRFFTSWIFNPENEPFSELGLLGQLGR